MMASRISFLLFLSLFVCALSLGLNGGLVKKTHNFSVKDMITLPRLSDGALSPDGKLVAFSRTKINLKNEKGETNSNTAIFVVSVDGDEPIQVTQGPSDSSPFWLDDATIAFSRGGQIWTVNLAVETQFADPIQLTNLALPVDSVKFNHESNTIFFSTEVYPGKSLEETKAIDEKKASDPSSVLIFDNLFARHWDEWYTGKYRHVFSLAVSKDEFWRVSGDPIDLMLDLPMDSPTRPFGGADEFDVSPDGSVVAFTSQEGEDIAWSTNNDIYLIDPQAKNKIKRITEHNKARDSSPVFSPDGKTIAYFAMKVPQFEADRFRITLYNIETEEHHTLTEEWDRSPDSLSWTSDGKFLVVTAQDIGRTKIFAICAKSGKARVLIDEHSNGGVTILPGDEGFVFSRNSFQSPKELFVANLGRSLSSAIEESNPESLLEISVQQLTQFSKEQLDSISMSNTEEFWFSGAQDHKVHGWLFKPVNFEQGKKYPLALLIHGGPQGAWLDAFSTRWHPIAFASAGFVTVAINPHGSTSYGQDFTDAVTGHWGSWPFEDLMKGVDFVIEKYPFVDENRLTALGGSYGGFMVNWINGHTDRFRALVVHDGVFDTAATFYAGDELWFPEFEFGGVPWKVPDNYAQWSPSRFVDNWKTPTLVIHGEKDYRLTTDQGLSVFTALRRKGVPSRILIFPDENHWVLKPANSLRWYEESIAWITKYSQNTDDIEIEMGQTSRAFRTA